MRTAAPQGDKGAVQRAHQQTDERLRLRQRMWCEVSKNWNRTSNFRKWREEKRYLQLNQKNSIALLPLGMMLPPVQTPPGTMPSSSRMLDTVSAARYL